MNAHLAIYFLLDQHLYCRAFFRFSPRRHTNQKETIIYNEVGCSNYKYNYINTYSLEFYSGSTVIHIK